MDKVLQIMVSIMNMKFREGKECQGLRDMLFPHILVLFHGHQMGSRRQEYTRHEPLSSSFHMGVLLSKWKNQGSRGSAVGLSCGSW